MKPNRFTFLIAVLIWFYSGVLVGQGYRISLLVPDLPDKNIILSHRFGLKFYTDDTVKSDSKGLAVFEGTNRLPEGMYQVVFPEKKFAEFFLDQNQIFSLKTWGSAPLDSLTFTGSSENSRFLEWQRKIATIRNRTGLIQNQLKKVSLSPDSIKLLNKELQNLQLAGSKEWDMAIHDLAGALPGNFIKGLKPVKVPDSLAKSDSRDNQFKQYQYIRMHFFDDISFTDEKLLRTPLIETKLDQFFKQVAPPVPDSIIQLARQMILLSKPSKEVYQFVVQYLFNLYSDPEIMGTDAVYVYLAENYYLAGETPWIDSANLRGIRVRVNEIKPLLIGKVAPEMEGLVTADEQPFELKNVKSPYLVLYFWSPDCGFCKEATPKLNAVYAELKQMGTEVVAVNSRLDKALWTKFIADHQLNWVNLYSPQKVKEILEKYQAFTTPNLFILDADRRIIAKNISVDQVKPFLTQYQSSRK